MGVVHCSNGWSLVQVEVRVLWIGWLQCVVVVEVSCSDIG